MNLDNIKTQLRGVGATAKKFMAPIARHHVVIAIIVISGMLMYTVVVVNEILSAPSDQEYLAEQSKESIQTRFDEATINRIEQLHERQDNPNPGLPSGRISPFIE